MEDAGRDAQLAIIAEIQDWKERDVRARGYILSTTEVSIYRLTPNIYTIQLITFLHYIYIYSCHNNDSSLIA